jgi:phospholipid/cholesterol/gamma-HCH transport system permease protein
MSREPGRFDIERTGDALLIRARGAWTVGSARRLVDSIAALQAGGAATAEIAIDDMEAVDTVGAMLLHRLRTVLAREGCTAGITGATPDRTALIERIAAATHPPPEEARPHAVVAVVEHIGRATVEAGREALGLLSFLGLVIVTVAHSLVRPRRLRLVPLIAHIERVGLNAMPIVGLLSFLIGVVVAFQGADQLKRFGAEIFTVDLLGLSVLREMGVLLTAIIVAGRSGSAFAAEIGTMQVNQEVDAIRTLGLDPVELLVLPRLLALTVALPLLTVFANVMGLTGGAIMSFLTLDITPAQFIERLRTSVPVQSYWVGIVKAPVFGFLIALIGCLEGLKASGSADSVGRQTTRAVVVSIFLVIVADAMFSVLFSVLGV